MRKAGGNCRVGDSYDNALAETINGLYKAEVIPRRGPWRNFEAVEFAIPPAEAEERYPAMLDQPTVAA